MLLASADVEQENGDAAAARRDLETGLQAHPDEARFHLGLATLDLRAGPEQRTAALQHLKDAETLLTGQAEGLWSVANLYIDAGETGKAEDILASLTEGGAARPRITSRRVLTSTRASTARPRRCWNSDGRS